MNFYSVVFRIQRDKGQAPLEVRVGGWIGGSLGGKHSRVFLFIKNNEPKFELDALRTFMVV